MHGFAAGVLLAMAQLCVAVESDGPLRIGGDKQLFLGPWADDGRDEHLVESMSHVTIRMNEAHVSPEPVLLPDCPWERIDLHQQVLQDGGRIRMYYSSRDFDALRRRDENSLILLYAESSDGLNFTKPELGLCEWSGSRANNILFPNDDFPYAMAMMKVDQIFIDPNAKSLDEKYKMFAHYSAPKDPPEGVPVLRTGHYPMCSADGIHWRLMADEPKHAGANDTTYSVMWDEQIGKYVQYGRLKPLAPEQSAWYKEHYGRESGVNVRMVCRAESDDFVDWGEATVIYAPDAIDKADSPAAITRVDFYGGNVSRYKEAPGAYISLPGVHSHWKLEAGSGGGTVAFPETIDVQLVTSRDGVQWNRTPERRPFIRLGPEGSFWSKMIFPAADIVRRGDELWVYFGAMSVAHHLRGEIAGGRGRAVMRLDGFISADAAYTGGELTTKPLLFEGAGLQLNVATGSGGSVKVEIQDETGEPLQGYSAEDACEISGNYIRKLASWRAEAVPNMGRTRQPVGDTNVGPLAGKPVKLRFVMRDAKLYSFQFRP